LPASAAVALTSGPLTVAAPDKLGLALGDEVDGVADAVADPVAVALADGAAEAVAADVPVAPATGPAFFVGALMGFGVGLGVGEGRGFDGVAAGARWPELACHANATNPPLETSSASTLTLEYDQRPDVPSDQNNPQYASPAGMVAQFASAGCPFTLQTTDRYCASRVSAKPALAKTAAAVLPVPHPLATPPPIAPKSTTTFTPGPVQ
jgi:hypothetical protein